MSEGQTQLEVDVEAGSAGVWLDERVYPLDAVYAACETFLDRCWLHLSRGDGRYRVVVTPKKRAGSEQALRALAGELGNELLSQTVRGHATRDNRAAIESWAAHAIAGAMGPLDGDHDHDEGSFDDPLDVGGSE